MSWREYVYKKLRRSVPNAIEAMEILTERLWALEERVNELADRLKSLEKMMKEEKVVE